MITSIQRGLREDGYEVSISQLCRWFDVPRRTVYYQQTKSAPRLRTEVVEPINHAGAFQQTRDGAARESSGM
jgi:putative transposase